MEFSDSGLIQPDSFRILVGLSHKLCGKKGGWGACLRLKFSVCADLFSFEWILLLNHRILISLTYKNWNLAKFSSISFSVHFLFIVFDINVSFEILNNYYYFCDYWKRKFHFLIIFKYFCCYLKYFNILYPLLFVERPTEILEKDIYICDSRYLEAERQIRKLTKGLKVVILFNILLLDELLYYINNAINKIIFHSKKPH